MVAKISHGSSLYGILAYNHLKMDQSQAKVVHLNRMIETATKEYAFKHCMRSFEPYLLLNQKTEKPILHISLNPDPSDRLSDEQYAQLAQSYMQQMGYADQPYIVYKHEDIDRHHLHIVSVRVDETGKKINDSYEYRRSMAISRKLEKDFKLKVVNEKTHIKELPLMPIHYKKGNLKQQLINVIQPISKSYHYQSINEYRSLLSLFNISVEEVKGEARGKPYAGLIYFALDKRGQKQGNPFKASLFRKSVGHKAICEQCEQSKMKIKEQNLKARTKDLVSKAMRRCSSRSGFEKELAQQQISVLFRMNEQKRIYGVTFIDHAQKTVLNGSRLGKEFSANVLHDFLNASHSKSQERIENKDNQQDVFVPSFENCPPFQTQGESILESTLDIFAIKVHGVNSEEEAYINTQRKKKKKRTRGL